MDWTVWRVVHARLATLTELQTTWSVHDLLDAHLVLSSFEVVQ